VSVILFERDVFGKLADWLRMKDMGRDPFFDTFTYEEKAQLYWTENRIWAGRDFDPGKHRESKLARWTDRLFLANQLAYYYTYDEDGPELLRLREEDIRSGPGMTDDGILELLEGVHYNVYTNGGNCFLGNKDEKKLRWYIRQLKDKILGTVKGR